MFSCYCITNVESWQHPLQATLGGCFRFILAFDACLSNPLRMINPPTAASYRQLSSSMWAWPGLKRETHQCLRPATPALAVIWRRWKSLLCGDVFFFFFLPSPWVSSCCVKLRCFLCGSCSQDLSRLNSGHTMARVRGWGVVGWAGWVTSLPDNPLQTSFLVLLAKAFWETSYLSRHFPLFTPGGRPRQVTN